MWTAKQTIEEGRRVLKLILFREKRVASYSEVLDSLESGGGVVDLLDSCIRDAPFSGVRFETPAVSRNSLNRSFEMVLIDSPYLSLKPNAGAFSQHFSEAVDGVCVFPNLGGDAVLVVPSPATRDDVYSHLTTFSRGAPVSQRHAFWRAVGVASKSCIGSDSVWLNTAGAGVSWLHFRIDSRPKYYRHTPYKHPADELG